jgi:hypothetical protein
MASTTPRAQGDQLARDETAGLIAASKVEGTYVYNRKGDHLGHIYDIMIDKKTGKTAYAVMSFGGFLGIGERYHPLPWSMLDYDVSQGGYVVDIDKSRLESGPSYDATSAPDWNDPAYGRRVDEHYGEPPAVYRN